MVLVLSATFDANAIDSFFTGADQLNLSIRTRDQMVVEGISSPVDLPDFNKDVVSQLSEHLSALHVYQTDRGIL